MIHALVHRCFFLEILFNLKLFFWQQLLQASINTKTNIFRRRTFEHPKLFSILFHFVFRLLVLLVCGLLVLLLFGLLFIDPFGKSKLKIDSIFLFYFLFLLIRLDLLPAINCRLLHTRLDWGVSTLHHAYLLQILFQVVILFFKFFRFCLLLL